MILFFRPDRRLWAKFRIHIRRLLTMMLLWTGGYPTLGASVASAAGSGENLPPELVQAIPPVLLDRGADAVVLDLADFIHDPDVPGTAVRLQVRLGAEHKSIDLALFDAETPATVANFLSYIEAGLYTDNFFHRSVPGFIIQGGGFRFLDATTFDIVPPSPPVRNEPGISNLRGTIAMAKLGHDPHSATSQWFINLADNSSNLDLQNGGFTVFGRVLGSGMAVADEIAALPAYNATSVHTAWTNLPLTDAYLARPYFVETTASIIPALNFTAVSANPELVSAAVSGSSLQLTPSTANSGETVVTVLATDLDGATREFDIDISVVALPTAPFTLGNLLITRAGEVREYTLEGELVQTIPVPHPQTSNRDIGDVVYDSTGRIHVLNFAAWDTSYISTYDPAQASWSHSEIPDSYHFGNLADGDLSIRGNSIYGKEFVMNLASRVVSPFSVDLFGGVSESAMGADGILYNINSGSPRGRVQRTHPVTFENIGEVLELRTADHHFINSRGVAVTPDGDIFAASHDGGIYQFDHAGNLLRTLESDLHGFVDIDLSNAGLLAAGTTDGHLLVTNTDLAPPAILSLGGGPIYVAFVETREFPVRPPHFLIEETQSGDLRVSVNNWTEAMSHVRVIGWDRSSDLVNWTEIPDSSKTRSVILDGAAHGKFTRMRYETP